MTGPDTRKLADRIESYANQIFAGSAASDLKEAAALIRSPLSGTGREEVAAWLKRYEPSEANTICKCSGNVECVYHSASRIMRSLSHEAPAQTSERGTRANPSPDVDSNLFAKAPAQEPVAGWQLVPTECTSDMVRAAPWVSNVRYGWKLMLAAAPAAPASYATREALERAADAIDAARYAHPEHPRERPHPFSGAHKRDLEYAFRLARAALAPIREDRAVTAEQRTGWRPIETAPADQNLLLGWWREWPALEWACTSGLAICTKGGWKHGQATHWHALPECSVTPPESKNP